MQQAAKAKGETLSLADCDYVIDKGLATGAIDANGDINFHLHGTREEIIDGMESAAKAWGCPISREEAEHMASQGIRNARVHRIQAIATMAAILAGAMGGVLIGAIATGLI